MITFPYFSDIDATKQLERWKKIDPLNDVFGANWQPGGEIFERCSWPVIQQNRVDLNEVAKLREALQENLPEDLTASPEETDLRASKVLWEYLAGGRLSLSQAADCGIWRWMAFRVIPDLIFRRFKGTFKDDRFLSVGATKRCWPLRMYWMAWMCSNENGVVSHDILAVLAKTDIQSGILERTGGGYDREMYQAILSVLGSENTENRARLARGMMKRLTAIRGAQETCILTTAGKMQLATRLLEWSVKYYRAD
jgi:hypothetical protein